MTFHPGAVKDLGSLDKPVQKQIKNVINDLSTGQLPLNQTHTLRHPLQGWSATKASRGHRIIHRPTDEGGIHIGYIGLHEYGKAERRLGAFDPHSRVRWKDGQFRSFRDAWGASHGNSTMITGAAAHLMGVGGYHHDDDEYRSGTAPERLALAHHALHVIHRSKGVAEPLYHGTKKPAAKALEPGDEVRLPLTATTGSADVAKMYGGDLDEHPGTVVHFPAGTPFYPQSENSASDRKEYELDHRWDEAITAGHFKVTHKEKDDAGLTHLHLEHLGTFNPHTKTWEPAISKTSRRRPKLRSRIFGPTKGALDPRLFDEDRMRPEVREAILSRLGAVLEPVLGTSWKSSLDVYLAGSEASEWWGNDDLDVLIGLDYDHLEDTTLEGIPDEDAIALINQLLWSGYNDENWHAPFGGVWHATAYANASIGTGGIRKIKPYAAYDILRNDWVVKPPHLEHWSLADFPEGPELLKEAEAYADLIEAIDKMPEPYRTRQGKALWDHLHAERSRAFSDEGEGWEDTGNVIEKALNEWGLWDKLVQMKYGEAYQKTGAVDGWEHVKGFMDPKDLKRSTPAIIYHEGEDEDAEDMRQNGIHTPIQVRHEKGTSRIMNGHHRHRVAEQEGFPRVPVVVRYREGDDPPNIEQMEPITYAEYHHGPGQTGHFPGWEHLKSLGASWESREIPAIHRGMGITLPQDVHDYVHDPSIPRAERAQRLLDYVGEQPHGMHWTDDPDVARGFASRAARKDHRDVPDEYATPVVIHAQGPELSHIETDKETLRRKRVRSYDDQKDAESEVPIKAGAPVQINAISWADPKSWRRDRYKFQRHYLDEPVQHTASSDEVPVEHILVSKLWPHREWDHARGAYSYDREGGGPYAYKHDAQSWDDNKASVASEGIHNPITLHYNPKQNSAYIGEGNHRLHWAKELGHETVPVRVWRTYSDMHPRFNLDEESPTVEGHFPQTPRPSSVLPASWFPSGSKTAAGWAFHPLDHTVKVEHKRKPDNLMQYHDIFPDLFKDAGKNGDLPEGLTFEHRPPNRRYPNEHVLIAHHPEGDDTPWSKYAGHITWFHEDPEVAGVNVVDKFKRRGLATELWKRAKQISPDLAHSKDVTSDGKGWINSLGIRMLAEDDDYRMQHRPPGRDDETAMPLHDLTRNMPADVYTHPHYYDPTDDPNDHSYSESHAVISRVRGKPDAKVRIYRSLPAEHAHQGFRPGDWVTLSKDYARLHGMQEDSKHDWPVISTVVKADDLHTHADDLREWGYNGTDVKPGSVAYKGGYHQEVRQRANGEIHPVTRKPRAEGQEMWGSHTLKLSPEDYHRAVHGYMPGEGAETVLKHLGPDVIWHPHVDSPEESWSAEDHARHLLEAQHSEGGHEPGTAPLLGVVVHTKNGKTIDKVKIHPHLDFGDQPRGYNNGFTHLQLGRSMKHPSLKREAAYGGDYYSLVA